MKNTTTDEALLRAAREIFARDGYEGASVRDITTQAGANLGSITYHFGSKRELYDRVVESVVSPLAERVVAVTSSAGPVRRRIATVVETYLDYIATNADLPRLMMQELVLGESPAEVVAGPVKRVHASLTLLIAEGQRTGEVRAGPAPMLAVFIVSVPVHLGMVRGAMRTHLILDVLSPALLAEVKMSAVSFVTAGLCVGGS